MPSTAHEIPILIFRNQPAVLLSLLRDALRATPLVYDRAEDKSNDLTSLQPVALRADLVLVFYEGEQPVLVLVLEVQRAPQEDKLRSWPAYVGELVFRYGCPVYLVVLAEDEATARWAAEPNPYFQLNSPFLPLVLGPEEVPALEDGVQATQQPGLALVSLSVHGGGPRWEGVATAAIEMARERGGEYKVLCWTLLMQLLDQAKRQRLEAKLGMDLQEYLRKNPHELDRIIRNFLEEQAQAKGKADSLLKVLAGRGLEVTPEEQQQILGCGNTEILDRWLLRSGIARSTAEVLAD